MEVRDNIRNHSGPIGFGQCFLQLTTKFKIYGYHMRALLQNILLTFQVRFSAIQIFPLSTSPSNCRAGAARIHYFVAAFRMVHVDWTKSEIFVVKSVSSSVNNQV